MRIGIGREPNVVANVSTAQNQKLRRSASAAGLAIRLLGPMMISHDGKSVAIASKKARGLLGYLALREGSEVSRSILTGLLWGERSEGQAICNESLSTSKAGIQKENKDRHLAI